jgi:hypothetical protein
MIEALPSERRRYLTRAALTFWREGEAEVLAAHRRAQRHAYECAIATVLAEMQHLRTVDDLLHTYLVERRRLALVTERACRAANRVRPISRVWVRDAAFWRRFRQALSSQPAPPVDPARP